MQRENFACIINMSIKTEREKKWIKTNFPKQISSTVHKINLPHGIAIELQTAVFAKLHDVV